MFERLRSETIALFKPEPLSCNKIRFFKLFQML